MKDFLNSITLSEQAQEWILQNPMPQQQYSHLKSMLKRSETGFVSELKKEPSAAQLFLAFAVRYAYERCGVLSALGVCEKIYIDTFRDIAIWEREYRRKFSVCGIDEYEWVLCSLTGRVTRLGRLQFELYPLEHDTAVGETVISAGSVILNVHIPAEEPLNPVLAEQSYRQALGFFRGVQPAFICESWLLGTELKNILPEASNILQFAKPYQIIETDDTCKQAQERIFGEWRENPNEYEEGSSLQRAAKKYLLAGNRLGSATGIFLAEDLFVRA